MALQRRFAGLLVLTGTLAACGLAFAAWPRHATATYSAVEVGYTSRASLGHAAAREGATIVRVVPALRVATLRAADAAPALAQRLRRQPGISYAAETAARSSAADPALALGQVSTPAGGAFEWQYYSTGVDRVPEAVAEAARNVTIAILDTGADVGAQDLVGKVDGTYDAVNGSRTVTDETGHGTFVASLAGGSGTNGTGIAGFGGEAKLLIVKLSSSATFDDVDVAAGIVYAVRHGARIVNLSVAGRAPSAAERRAVAFAAQHGVLCVAAVGNDALNGNPPEYPAALLQPVGSNGRGGTGLAVAASGTDGQRASFSGYGSFVSLAAPGVNVFGELAPDSAPAMFPRTSFAGAGSGLYGFASGTSFAAPEVSGAAALVWAANPSLTAAQVARILEETASGGGAWTPELGYGVIDVAAAVDAALAAGL